MARPGISTKNTEKIPLGPKFWNFKKIPQKYQKNTKNAHFWYFGAFFRYFRGILGVNSGSFGPRGIFSVFFMEIPGRAISELCSRSAVLKVWKPAGLASLKSRKQHRAKARRRKGINELANCEGGAGGEDGS